jgi:glycosyltransferase involved in cell wall biosynthesis
MAEVPARTPPLLTVVIPAYNEEANVEPCYRELVGVLEAAAHAFEVILVDDGSTDGTAQVVRRLSRADARLRPLRLRRNAGQTAALDAGFRAARGAIVVTMDADLQNDPRDIPKLLAALPGHDAVCGWRVDRQDPWTKRMASRVANVVRDRFTRDGIHDTGCTLKAFRREALQRLHLYRGLHRFLPALLQMEGLRVTEIPVSHRPRRSGVSKYGNWRRLWSGLADLWAVRWMATRRLRYELEDQEP